MRPTEREMTAVLGLLAMLAEQCNEKVSEARLEFMAEQLLVNDAGNVVTALKALMRTARRFPTVAEVEKEMGVSGEDSDAIGREVADRMYAALKRWGSTKMHRDKVNEYIGPVGIELVRQLGGWDHLCETVQEKDQTIHKAQWRESAIVLADKAKRGDLNAVPGATLTAVPQKPGLSAVTPDALMKALTGGGDA